MLTVRILARAPARAALSSSRQFSTIHRDRIRHSLLTPLTSSTSSLSLSRTNLLSLRSSLISTSNPRFKSTVAATASTIQPSPAPEFVPEATQSSDEVFQQLSEFGEPIKNVLEPHIGMLKEAGLNFGWGMTSTLQWILEHFYVLGGGPWWVALVATALVYRGVMFFPMMRMSDHMAKVRAIEPAMREIRERVNAMDIDPTQKSTLLRTELLYLNQQTGVTPLKGYIPIVFQVYIGFCFFRMTRHLSQTAGVGLSDGGIAWLSNLHLADPYYILPVGMGIAMHLLGRFGGETANLTNLPSWMRVLMLYVLPGTTSLWLAFQPAAVAIPVAVMGTFSVIQARLFRNPAFRRYFKLQPFPTGPIHFPGQKSGPASKTVTVKATKKSAGNAATEQPKKNFLERTLEAVAPEQLAQARGMTGAKADPVSKIDKQRGKTYMDQVRKYDESKRKQLRSKNTQKRNL